MNVPLAYPLIMAVAMATGVLLGRRRQESLGLSRTERWGLAGGAFCGAMIGAKLPFVLSDWDGLLSGMAWLDGGKTILCGLAGGYLGVEVAKWALDIRVKTGDSFAVPVAASIGVGRLACFAAGCCYGLPTQLPWGVVFPAVDAVPRHPTQLYEALFHLTAAVLLWRLEVRSLLTGQRVKAYILAYLFYRLLSEWLRPEARLAGGLTGYQWAALALMPLFVWLWRRDAARRIAAERDAGCTAPAPIGPGAEAGAEIATAPESA